MKDKKIKFSDNKSREYLHCLKLQYSQKLNIYIYILTVRVRCGYGFDIDLDLDMT